MDDARVVTTDVRQRRRAWLRLVLAGALRVELPMAALWLMLGGALAVIASRVVDWYVMTDELLYERLAISIGRLHSPLPRVHGEVIGNVNQLYPLLLAPLYGHGLIPASLHEAHVLNGFLMTSASIPTFLLTRRVTERPLLPYAAAALSVCIPWIALSSFLLTEVVAYPVFLWGMLAFQRCAVDPGTRGDLFALLCIALAILARTQFAVLLLVLPMALFVHQLTFVGARERSWRRRLGTAVRELVAAHRVLAGLYAALVLAAVALLAAGRLSSALGTYSVTAKGNLFPSGMASSLLAHLATVSLGLGILPFVVGAAWLLTAIVRAQTREQHAFASIAIVTIVALLFEVTSYDLRFGVGLMHDRYLFYVVPLVLIGLAAARSAGEWPRWSLLVPAGLVAVGFFYVNVRRFDKFNVDSPVAVLNGGLRGLGGSVDGARALLALGTIVATIVFVEACVLLRRPQVATLLVGVALLTVPAVTGAGFYRLLSVDGTSGRPITLDQGVVFDWIDRTLGPNTRVTMVPYPVLRGDYWANGGYWWNVEFWNASVQREAVYNGGSSWTPETFPKTTLGFDPSTGRANVSPSEYIAQADRETRFRIAGKATAEYRGVVLIATEQPWRAQWLTFGLNSEGATVPGTPTRIRVFATPEQTTSLARYLAITVQAQEDVGTTGFDLRSNSSDVRGQAVSQRTEETIPVCVPARGFADVRLATHSGPVMVTQIALADETGSC